MAKISLIGLMKRLLTEKMTFRGLMSSMDKYKTLHDKLNGTDSGSAENRKKKASGVRVKSLGVASVGDDEAWNFSYKSANSTTGVRWNGMIRFFKNKGDDNKSVDDIECHANCTCPDFRYVWAKANSDAGAGVTGRDPEYRDIKKTGWNDNNGTHGHRIMNPNNVPGLCKHLIALASYLKTKIDPSNKDMFQEIQRIGRISPSFRVDYND